MAVQGCHIASVYARCAPHRPHSVSTKGDHESRMNGTRHHTGGQCHKQYVQQQQAARKKLKTIFLYTMCKCNYNRIPNNKNVLTNRKRQKKKNNSKEIILGLDWKGCVLPVNRLVRIWLPMTAASDANADVWRFLRMCQNIEWWRQTAGQVTRGYVWPLTLGVDVKEYSLGLDDIV